MISQKADLLSINSPASWLTGLGILRLTPSWSRWYFISAKPQGDSYRHFDDILATKLDLIKQKRQEKGFPGPPVSSRSHIGSLKYRYLSLSFSPQSPSIVNRGKWAHPEGNSPHPKIKERLKSVWTRPFGRDYSHMAVGYRGTPAWGTQMQWSDF